MKKIEVEYADEHQNGDEVFNEVFEMQYADKKAKFEWNQFIYVQFGILAVAVILNFIFPSLMMYILILAAVLIVFCYYLNTKKRREMLANGRIKKVRLKNDQRGVSGYQTVKPKNAHEIMKEDCLIIEVSIKDYYDEMHVKGAISIPLEVLEEEIKKMDLDPNKTILVYSRGEDRSKQGAQLLIDLGFKDVYEFGSIMEWPYDVEMNDNEDEE